VRSSKKILGAVLILTLATFTGCGKKSDVKQQSKGDGQALVDVNGVTISTADFKKEMEALPPYLKPMTDTPEGKKEMIDTMVIRELILQQAQKDGIDKTQAVADKLEDLKKRVIVEAYLKKKVEERAALSDADLQKFYDQNKDKFKSGDEIKASHILVKSEKEAKDILAKLKAGGKFEELAKKYSVDSAGPKGGDLGWFSKGSMVPEFEKVAFGLKEGEMSGVVKTNFGFHIIKVTGTRKAGIRPFDEVKEQIKASLLPTKQQEVFQTLKEELKKSGKVTYKEDAMKSLGAAIPSEKKPATPPGVGTPDPAPAKK
jgi:peptidyl-prolyl cis-trans isomerase C